MRLKNKMIEIFNLGLNSSMSRDEMQTKRPFGEKHMDYRISLLVHRDASNHSCLISSCRLCLMLLYAFYSPWRISVINVLLSMKPFKEQTLIFWCCNFPGVFMLNCLPAACYKRLYVFQVTDPYGIMKYIAYWMQEELPMSMCACLYIQMIFHVCFRIWMHLNASKCI